MKGDLAATVIIDIQDQWKESSLDATMEVKQVILDDHFWVDVKFVVEFVEPICDMLCYVYTNSLCLSGIYENMDSMCETI